MSKYSTIAIVLISLFLYCTCNNLSEEKSLTPDSSLCHVVEHPAGILTMHQIDSIVLYDDNIDTNCLHTAIQYLLEQGDYGLAVNLSYKLPSNNSITWARRIEAFQGLDNIDSSLYYCTLWLSHTRINHSPDSLKALTYIGQVYESFQRYDSALVYYQDVATLYSINSPFEFEPENTYLKVFMCFFRIGKKEDGIQYLKANSPQLIVRYQLDEW